MRVYDIVSGVLGWFLAMVSLGLIVVALIALPVAVVVGTWDVLVWLTKSDWRTTNFDIPLIALVVAVVSAGLNNLILDTIEWFERK